MRVQGRAIRALFGALITVALFASGSPASAKIVGSGYDPTLFDGIGHFFIPDPPSPCLDGNGFELVNLGFTTCNGVKLLDASVNVNDGLGDTAHLTLPAQSLDIFGIVLDQSAPSIVVGVDSALIPLSASGCAGPVDLCDSSWFIEWISIPPFHDHPLFNEVVLYRETCQESDSDFSFLSHPRCTKEPFGSPATHVEFTPVPEPGSLFLLGGALAAGWLVRRRKTQR